MRLILIRHAKAAEGSTDVDRPLTPRGCRDAGAIGLVLTEAGVVPDRVIVSPARRAQQTWDAAQAVLGAAAEVVVDDRIYDNEVAALFAVISDTPVGTHTLVLVGHNPSFGQLAQALDDASGDAAARQELSTGYPTGGVAVFEVIGNWGEVRPHTATLRSFTVPRSRS